MIALYNFVPKFCPNCGRGHNFDLPRLADNRQEYLDGSSQGCPCGLDYQYAQTKPMLTAAGVSGGDLKNYVKP